jgi:hypothetical protein
MSKRRSFDKSAVYYYISQIGDVIDDMLSKFLFKKLFESEIINEALVCAREINDTSFSDEDTAKNLVVMGIDKLYNPKSTQNIIDKYWNKRVVYGFTVVPENAQAVQQFRKTIDLTSPINVAQKERLKDTVRKIKLRKPTKELKIETKWWLSLIFIAILVVGYLFALNGRYHYIGGSQFAVDKWTNTVVIPENNKQFLDEANN